MALVLSLRQGQDFFVGETRFVIEHIENCASFEVKRVDGTMFSISDAKAAEIMPDVFLSAGGQQNTQLAKLVIEAPPAVRVLRGERKRNPPVSLSHAGAA